ncbi:LPXTG cell wall anchor domain-containing protein, partial [Bacillus cereus group sp. BfR-BA-01316]
GENPTTPPTGDGGNGENPTTPPTGDGGNGENPTTVSENKEAEKDERDLPKTGTSVTSTIGAGLAFVGAGLLMLFRRKKANR